MDIQWLRTHNIRLEMSEAWSMAFMLDALGATHPASLICFPPLRVQVNVLYSSAYNYHVS